MTNEQIEIAKMKLECFKFITCLSDDQDTVENVIEKTKILIN
jgi:hypothetical protein